MNNSYNYQYREEGQRSTYTTPQYDDVVKKYTNLDLSQQRSTLAVNQGLNQGNFSRSVNYQPGSTAGDSNYGYTTQQYQTNYSTGQPQVYQDRFSGIKNVQIKEVQSPEKNVYGQYDFQEENDRVKKSKKNVTITKTTTTYENDVKVADYQPMLIGYEGQQGQKSYNQNQTASQILFIDNPDLLLQNRSSSTLNYRLESQNKVESKSIQDQNITLCNIF